MATQKKAPPSFAVEIWPIERPVPYAKNPRQISQQAVNKVAASIDAFGFRQPIVVDSKGVIVIGHTRLQAAQKLGHTNVPVHVAKNLKPNQIKALRIADNRTGEETSWENDLLSVELEELKAAGADLELTGFEFAELSQLLKDPPDAPDGTNAVGKEDKPEEEAKWLIVVECAGEAERAEVLQRLRDEGLNCITANSLNLKTPR